MNCSITSSESLADMVKQIAEGLLRKKLEIKAKNYVKLDFNILDQDDFFSIQVTKCSSDKSNFRFLLTDAFKKLVSSQKLADNDIVATVQQKSVNVIRKQQFVYCKNSELSLGAKLTPEEQKEFSILKHYICVKLLFKVHNSHLKEFSSLLLCYIKQVETLDGNIKFLYRKNKQHIYRNRVQMDDIILSCKILSSSCTNVFENSKDDVFRKNLMNLFGMKKRNTFEEYVGPLLLAQANNNFTKPTGRHHKSL